MAWSQRGKNCLGLNLKRIKCKLHTIGGSVEENVAENRKWDVDLN